LAGLLLRDRGAFWRPRTGRPAELAADHVARAWGRAIAAAGALMLIVTALLMLLAPSDAMGGLAIGLAGAMLAAGAVVWGRMAGSRPMPAAARARASRQAAATTRPAPAMPSRVPGAALPRAARPAPPQRTRPSSGVGVPEDPARLPANDPMLTPATEEIDPAMNHANATFDRAYPQVDPSLTLLDASGSGRSGGNLLRVAQAGIEEEIDRVTVPIVHASVAAAAEKAVAQRVVQPAPDPADDRAAAFAPIPLFRETDPADDLAAAFAPLGDGGRGSERPLPWELAADPETEFFVDPSLDPEASEQAPPPPPIPFARPSTRG
ncbi:MAG: hypothetical protein ACR2J8_09160, partial [Thermomicrobiales bacterium]